MLTIPDSEIAKQLDYKKLIEALREIFKTEYTQPVRHHHFYKTPAGDENTLILMPVWNSEFMGLKQVTVALANAKNDLPSHGFVHPPPLDYRRASVITGVQTFAATLARARGAQCSGEALVQHQFQ